MNDSVRAEIRRRQSEKNSPSQDLSQESSQDNEENVKITLLSQMEDALEKGDIALAESLRDQFVLLKSLRADPTQSEGAYDPYLDQVNHLISHQIIIIIIMASLTTFHYFLS